MQYSVPALALTALLLLAGCAEKDESLPAAEEPLPYSTMKVTSSAFTDGGTIPEKYTCKTGDVSPPLSLEDIPTSTRTLALIVDDPDAPSGTWVHWVVWNIPPVSEIKEDTVPEGAVQGIASDGRNAYHSPCPPSGTHRYYYKVYALDTQLDLSAESKKKDLEDAMSGHVLAKAELMGRVSR